MSRHICARLSKRVSLTCEINCETLKGPLHEGNIRSANAALAAHLMVQRKGPGRHYWIGSAPLSPLPSLPNGTLAIR